MLKRLTKKKKKIKTVNSKVTTELELSTTKPKNKNKNKLSKQLEQELIHRNRDHMEGYWWGWGAERRREKVQGMRNITSRYKIDRGRLRIIWEMEKPKMLYVRPMDMN